MKQLSQTPIACTLMRGGTSKGPYFLASDLPGDQQLRDRVLLAVMGSPDARQIDGVGGADPLTSKVAIVARSSRPGIDVDYLFAQVSVDRALVDVTPNCGNMLAGVGPLRLREVWWPHAMQSLRSKSTWLTRGISRSRTCRHRTALSSTREQLLSLAYRAPPPRSASISSIPPVRYAAHSCQRAIRSTNSTGSKQH